MSDESQPGTAPAGGDPTLTETATPPGGVTPPPASAAPESRGTPRWTKWLLAVCALLVAVALAGFAIKLPYYSFSPGGTLPLAERVSVKDATTYPSRGDLRLLYVREQSDVNVWQWVRASLDHDIDLVKRQNVTGCDSPAVVGVGDAADMAAAKLTASKVGLQSVGKTVRLLPGVSVFDTAPGEPAANVLKPNDVIERVDGAAIEQPLDLSRAVARHEVGEDVKLDIVRKGKAQQVSVPVAKDCHGREVIGVFAMPRYSLPAQVSIDTRGISGPSAGLAMTLAIIDDLTPGNLTGGQRVAVTGTIAPDGSVGEIGAIEQKAVTARTAGAHLFLVPKCTDPSDRSSCEKDLQRARERAGAHVKVVPVATVADALHALEQAGGAPVDVHAIS